MASGDLATRQSSHLRHCFSKKPLTLFLGLI
jgi:hypothetical protein